METCIFCKIVKGELPADFVYQDDEVAVFKDINPVAPVHLLVVPKKHIPSLQDAVEEDQMLLGKLLLTAKKVALEQGIAGSGYRLSLNNGRDAGQAVDHLHIHLLAGRKLALG